MPGSILFRVLIEFSPPAESFGQGPGKFPIAFKSPHQVQTEAPVFVKKITLGDQVIAAVIHRRPVGQYLPERPCGIQVVAKRAESNPTVPLDPQIIRVASIPWVSDNGELEVLIPGCLRDEIHFQQLTRCGVLKMNSSLRAPSVEPFVVGSAPIQTLTIEEKILDARAATLRDVNENQL